MNTLTPDIAAQLFVLYGKPVPKLVQKSLDSMEIDDVMAIQKKILEQGIFTLDGSGKTNFTNPFATYYGICLQPDMTILVSDKKEEPAANLYIKNDTAVLLTKLDQDICFRGVHGKEKIPKIFDLIFEYPSTEENSKKTYTMETRYYSRLLGHLNRGDLASINSSAERSGWDAPGFTQLLKNTDFENNSQESFSVTVLPQSGPRITCKYKKDGDMLDAIRWQVSQLKSTTTLQRLNPRDLFEFVTDFSSIAKQD